LAENYFAGRQAIYPEETYCGKRQQERPSAARFKVLSKDYFRSFHAADDSF
jgi:hypothetical protein